MNNNKNGAGGAELNAFYAGLRRSGKGPSKEHPCARCPIARTLACSYSHPASMNEGPVFKGKKGKKGVTKARCTL